VKNESGIYPVDDVVVIEVIPVVKKVGSILLAGDTVQQEEQAQIHGYLVARGKMALEHPGTAEMTEGDLILHSRYAGERRVGVDGKWYRVMRAECVLAKLDAVVEQTTLRGRMPVPLDNALDRLPTAA
jgi:co-chaperonin GroES (HSP10)